MFSLYSLPNTTQSSWLKPQDAASVIVSADKFVKKDVDTSSVTKGKIGELQLLWVTKIDANSGKTFYYNRKTVSNSFFIFWKKELYFTITM